jgi:hypothetical protein
VRAWGRYEGAQCNIPSELGAYTKIAGTELQDMQTLVIASQFVEMIRSAVIQVGIHPVENTHEKRLAWQARNA